MTKTTALVNQKAVTALSRRLTKEAKTGDVKFSLAELPVLLAALPQMTQQARVAVYDMLRKSSSVLTKSMETVRTSLTTGEDAIPLRPRDGEKTSVYAIGAEDSPWGVRASRNNAKEPSANLLRELARKKNAPDDFFLRQTVTWEHDSAKTLAAIVDGTITQEELDACRPPASKPSVTLVRR